MCNSVVTVTVCTVFFCLETLEGGKFGLAGTGTRSPECENSHALHLTLPTVSTMYEAMVLPCE